MEEKRLNFFADINKQIFVIVGGLIAVSTLIPLFINRLGSIFGFPVSCSYYFFVFLYFAFPVIFYLLYCSIYDYVGFLKLIPPKKYERLSPSQWKKIELGFILLIFLWLCWGNLYSKWASILLYVISIGIFFSFLFSKSYKVIKGSWKEFRIIGFSVISIFTLFLFSKSRLKVFEEPVCEQYKLLQGTNNINAAAFDIYSKQKEIPDSLIKPIDQLITKYQNDVIKVSIQNPNRPFGTIKLSNNDSLYFNEIFKAINQFERKNIDSANSSDLRDTIITIANQLWPHNTDKEIREDTCYKLYQTFLTIQSYLQIVVQEKSLFVKKYWALLLSNLQVKGLTWFFFLVIVCLCLWLQSMKELSDKAIKNINASQQARDKAGNEIQKINDNSDQIRSMFFIILLLTIPFFKDINEKTINLSMPFVDFGIEKFYQSDVNIYGEETDYTSEFTKIKKQLSEIEIFTNEQRRENEKNRKRIDIISRYTIDLPQGETEYKQIDSLP